MTYKAIVEAFLHAHQSGPGLIDAIDKHGDRYTSQFLADTIARAAALSRLEPSDELGMDLRDWFAGQAMHFVMESQNADDAKHAALAQAEQPVAWQCNECGCRTYARVDALQSDGSFAPGPEVRCVECKRVFAHPPAKREAGVVKPFHVSRSSDGEREWYSARDPAAGVTIPLDTREKAYALVSSLNRAFALHLTLSTSSTPADGEDAHAPVPNLVGADHVDKAQAWDAAQASFQKGFEKGKATALAAAGSLNEKAILVAVQNFEDETGGFGESENEKVVRGVVSAYLSALTTTEGSDNG